MPALPSSSDPCESRLVRIGSVLVLHGAVLGLGLAMVCSGSRWGREDWDYFAHHYEAMRRTVVEYGQVPWWNPWSCGGIPLTANPQIGLVSINFPLVLVLGTYAGLKWAALAHLLLSAEGARRLGAQWLTDPVA